MKMDFDDFKFAPDNRHAKRAAPLRRAAAAKGWTKARLRGRGSRFPQNALQKPPDSSLQDPRSRLAQPE
jgi:hypothetical protein